MKEVKIGFLYSGKAGCLKCYFSIHKPRTHGMKPKTHERKWYDQHVSFIKHNLKNVVSGQTCKKKNGGMFINISENNMQGGNIIST